MMSQDTRLCEAAGKLLVKDMVSNGISEEKIKESFKESYDSGYFRFREDVDTGNSGALFITALASVIRHAVEPNMVGLELLQQNYDLMNGGGKGAIKLPKEKRVTAAEVAEGGIVTYTGEGYDSIVVQPTKKVAASKITWEMVKRAMVSMIRAEAVRVGKAIARKVDSDIITGITNVCSSANSNRVATGGASTRISYNKLVDTIATVEGYDVGGFHVTHIVIHPDDYAALVKDTNFQLGLTRAPITSGQPGSANVELFPIVEFFGGRKIVQTAQVTTGTTLVVDANELGTFVHESDVEVVDSRIPGSVDSEVIALKSYGIGIQNVRASASCVMAAS